MNVTLRRGAADPTCLIAAWRLHWSLLCWLTRLSWKLMQWWISAGQASRKTPAPAPPRVARRCDSPETRSRLGKFFWSPERQPFEALFVIGCAERANAVAV